MAENQENNNFNDLIYKGLYQEALSILNNNLEDKNISQKDFVTNKISEITILLYQGKNDQALKESEQLIKKLPAFKRKLDHLRIYALLSEVYWRAGDLHRGLDFVDKGEDLFNLEFKSKNKHLNCYTRLMLQKGIIFNLMEKKDQSIKYINIVIDFSKKLDNNTLLIQSINQLGVYYGRLGDLHRSKDCFEKGLKLSTQTNYSYGLITCKSNLGYIYFVLGDVKRAEQLTEECINMSLETDNIPMAATTYINLGNINRATDKFIDSYYYYNKALLLRKKIGNDFFIAESLYHLIILAVENQMETYAKSNLELLHKIFEKNKITLIEQYYNLATGYVKVTTGTLKEKREAIKNFDIVINQTIIDHELTVFALLNKFDVLLEELSVSKTEKVLPKLYELSDKITEIAKDIKSSSLHADTFILQSRLAILEGDFAKAEKLLNEAKYEIKDKNLDKLNRQIILEKELLNKHKYSDEKLNSEDILEENLGSVDLDDFIDKMSKKQTLITKDQPSELIDYLHDLNHDVNNHINSIIMFCELMVMDKELNDEYLHKIVGKSKQISALFKQGIRYIEAGEILNLEKDVDLNLIMEMVKELIIPNGIIFTKDNLPSINCDKEKVKQLFSNLFENAVIHGNPKSIQVKLESTNKAYFIKISNDGSPIPKNLYNKIFDRGFTTRKGNMGLGTSIMMKICHSHGWDLSLQESELTSFIISIPK
jgi:tetratricopeptide (TPR) repeat protein